MKLYKLLLIALLYLFTPFFGATQTTPAQSNIHQQDNLDSVLNAVRKHYNAPGFSVAVIKNDSLIYVKGFGLRDIQRNLPATPQTLYPIGSNTKAFTVAVLAKLLSDGHSLDDKVIKYLPGFHMQDGRESELTLRDLMTHRTGLSRYDLSWYFFNSNDKDSLINRIQYMEPSAPIRSKFQYNNFMYMVLGRVIERITGKSWQENIKTTILQPLSMNRTNFTAEQLAADSNAATGYTTLSSTALQRIPYFNIKAMEPAGSLNSNVLEMANWMKLWLSGGNYNGQSIIPSAVIKEAMSSQIVVDPALPSDPEIFLNNYGLGWTISSYRGHYRVEHSGAIDGFMSTVCLFPAEALGIVVLTNQENPYMPSAVRNLIADKYLSLRFHDWDAALLKAVSYLSTQNDSNNQQKDDALQVKGTPPSHPLKDYANSYFHPAYGIVKVLYKNDSLQLQLGTNNYYLSHYHFDVFKLKSITHIPISAEVTSLIEAEKLNFQMDQDGKIAAVTLQLDLPSGAPARFEKILEPVHLSDKALSRYTGTYSAGGPSIQITTKNGKLYMDVPGQPTYTATANEDGSFSLEGLKGYYIRFEFDKQENKASTLYAIQPEGTYKLQRTQK